MAFTRASFSPANLLVYYIMCTTNLSRVISQNTQKTMQDARCKGLKLLETKGYLVIFTFFPFPKKKNQDTLYQVWNKHGYINLLISGVINAQPMV